MAAHDLREIKALFITVSLLILLLIIVVCVVMALRTDDRETRRGGVLVAGAALLLAAIVAALNMITIVQGYEVGVPISFGRVGAPLPAGLHVVAPWTRVETYPTRPLAVPDIRVTARTKQAGQVNVTAAARWSVVAQDAGELYFQVRTGDEDYISSTIVDKALGQAIGNVFANLTNADAVSDRKTAEADLKGAVADLVKPYGIQINSLFLRQVEPDPKTADSIARLAAQQRATEIAIEANKTAIEENKRRLTEALGLQNAARQLGGLTPTQIMGICAQAWERQQQAATDAHVAMYTTPCGGSAGLAVK